MWDKRRAYLQVFAEFYLNYHNSIMIGKLHWKVLYKKEILQIEKWIFFIASFKRE